jgi:hypothetical protein
MHTILANISLPAVIYIGMGFVLVRILIDRELLSSSGWLKWFQLLIDALRIILFWPLVLFTEKLVDWLALSAGEKAQHIH